MLTVGDKVKFLDATGGGIVSKVIDSRMVQVKMEDGFEIPTLASELIKIEPSTPAGRFFEPHYDVALPEKVIDEGIPEDDRMRPLPDSMVRERKSEEIFLAYVPQDQKWLITGLIDIYLLNNSSYDVLYNIFSLNQYGHYEGKDYGSLFPDAKLLITTINREELTQWTEGSIQFLFHRQKVDAVLPPFNSDFSVDGKRFFKEANYRYHPVIQSKGLVVRVLSLTGYFHREDKVEPGPEAPESTPATEKDELIGRYLVAPREAEVDLHIHELVDDPVNMEKGEILDFQKSYFRRCLNSAISNHFLKVIFIHGTGNGVLKKELINEMGNYPGLDFFDAPLSKYGVGAIEVRIPHNHP